MVTDKHWEPARGLPPGASFVLRFGMSGEACGIPAYTIAAAWNGTKLIRLPMLQSVADGGEWGSDERYVYPSQKGGKPGLLRIRADQFEAIENSEAVKESTSWKSYRYDPATQSFQRTVDR